MKLLHKSPAPVFPLGSGRLVSTLGKWPVVDKISLGLKMNLAFGFCPWGSDPMNQNCLLHQSWGIWDKPYHYTGLLVYEPVFSVWIWAFFHWSLSCLPGTGPWRMIVNKRMKNVVSPRNIFSLSRKLGDSFQFIISASMQSSPYWEL